MDPWNVLLVLAVLFMGAAALFTVGVGVAAYLVASELRLFLRAPAYYVRKLLGPPGHAARARAIAKRVHELLPPARSDPLLREAQERVRRAVGAIQQLEKQREAIVLYLDYDVPSQALGPTPGADPAELDVLETRRGELEETLEDAVASLERIQHRVATRVLGSRDGPDEGDLQGALDASLEELDALIEAEQSVGLLPER